MPYGLRLRWDGKGRLGIVQQRLEVARDQPVVGRVVGHPQAYGLALDAAQHQVHPFRHPSLDDPQQIGVHADLQHGGRRGLAGQLGVPDFVAPRPQVAGRLDAAQEVGVPQPPSIQQHGLVNHVGARPHRFQRGRVFRPNLSGRGYGVGRSDFLHSDVLCPQRFQEAGLVLLTAPRHAIQHGVVAERAFEVSQRRRALQVRQVPALQETHQIGGGVGEALVDQLHRGITGPSPLAGEIRSAPGMRSAQARRRHAT